MKQSGFVPVLIVILIAVVALGGYLAYQQVNKASSALPPNQVTCTQDAKLCPDGAYVSRVPPNCEFSSCTTPKASTASADISNWKTYTSNKYKFAFKYPPSWSLVAPSDSYIDIYDRPDITEPLLYDGDSINISVGKPNVDRVQIADPLGTKKELASGVFEEKIAMIRLDNLEAAKFFTDVAVDSPTDATLSINVRANLNSDVLKLSFSSKTRDKQEFQKRAVVFNQILSTFRFE